LIQSNGETALAYLIKYGVIYFACYRISNYIDPFNNGLILQESDGIKERTDKFTVRQISDMNLEKMKIIYFSVCSTVENRAEELVNKMIYFASEFQVAGFNHIIISIWATDDKIYMKIIGKFYGQLKNGCAENK
jgi:CHAT domain-containing protein